MFVPAPRPRIAMPTITPFSDEMTGLSAASPSAPTSAGFTTIASLFPLRLPEPFPVAKAWVCNGNNLGVGESFDIGVYAMTDMASGRLDMLRSTGPVYSAGTANVVYEAGTPQVVVYNVTSPAGSSTDATSYTTAVVALSVGKMYMLVVENSKAAAADVVSSIDNGPTFTSRGSQTLNGALNRLSIWTAVPATNYTGTLVINFGANTQTGCVWSLVECSGVDTTTNDGVVQIVTASGNTTTPTVTLAAFGSAYNATYFACSNVADTTTTPKVQFAELSDANAATPLQTLETQWSAINDTTPNGTITSGEWGAIGIEIKAQTSVPSQPWRIARANLTASFSDTDASTYATASVTLKAGRLYLLSVENTHGTSATAVSAVTGGPTFTSRSTTQFNSNLNRTSIWSAVPTTDYVGTLTIAFGGTTQTSCIWSLNEFSGADTTTDDGIVQQAVNTGTGSGMASASLAAFGSSANSTFVATGTSNGSSHTVGVGMTLLSTTASATPAARMSTEARHDDVRNPGTTVTTNWGKCAVEIKCDTSAFVIPPQMPGNPNLYMVFVTSGATAAILVTSKTWAACAASGMLQLSVTTGTPLPSTASAVAVTLGRSLVLAGFSSRSLIG